MVDVLTQKIDHHEVILLFRADIVHLSQDFAGDPTREFCQQHVQVLIVPLLEDV